LQLSNDYRDNRLSTFFNWAITGASLIGGSVGYKQRRHEEVEQRDFDGWTGSVTWTWVPTGRTRLSLARIRDIGGSTISSSPTREPTQLHSIHPNQLTSKISLNGTALYQDLRFFGNTGLPITTTPSGTLADRHDKIGTLGFGAGYQVTRVFSLGLNYTWSHRNSNVAWGTMTTTRFRLRDSSRSSSSAPEPIRCGERVADEDALARPGKRSSNRIRSTSRREDTDR
jgi:hypothetical protein